MEDGYQSIVAWIHLFSSRNTPESVWFQQTDYPFQIARIVKQKRVWDKNSNLKIILYVIDTIFAAELMNNNLIKAEIDLHDILYGKSTNFLVK